MADIDYYIGDVVIVDAKKAKNEIMYEGPSIGTITKKHGKLFYIDNGFANSCTLRFIISLATPLLKELA